MRDGVVFDSGGIMFGSGNGVVFTQSERIIGDKRFFLV